MNQRILLTKRMLKEALIQIMHTKPIEKITIYEICETANINRSTFYKYYGSQYDLLNDAENDIFEAIERSLRESKSLNYGDGLRKILEQILLLRASSDLPFAVFLNQNMEREFTEKLFNLQIIQDLIGKYASHKYKDWEVDYLKFFFCHGGYSIIKKWIEDGVKQSTDEIAELIIKIGERLITPQE